MRPLRLELQAFGSFPGNEVVDFAALGGRGLFAVTGPTGAGKTTIFDAMVFALYGVLPGGRAADGDPRSHHADPTVETYATLEFEVDHQRYIVRRTPKFERPKRSGTGVTTQPATALLVRVVGETSEALATQPRECTQLCEALVGLDARQFQRVVLLPQGKFTDFLIATDEERERLLRQLFGGELFELATRWLKERMLELDGKVLDVDHELQRLRANATDQLAVARAEWGGADAGTGLDAAALVDDDTAVLDALDALEPARDAHLDEVTVLQAAAVAAAEARAVAEAGAQLFDEATATRQRLAALEAGRDSIEATEARVAASRRARPVAAAADAQATARAEAGASDAELADVYQRVDEAFAAIARAVPAHEPAAVAAAVEAADAELAQQRQLWHAVQAAHLEAVRAATTRDRAAAEHDECVRQVAELRDGIELRRAAIEALEPVAAELAGRTAARDAAAQRLEQHVALATACGVLDDAATLEAVAKQGYVEVMALFVASQAPRLAATLVDGDPCPVCGAAEHPAPAVAAGHRVVGHDEVEAAQAQWRAAADAAAAASAQVQQLRQVLGDAHDASTETLSGALASAESLLLDASRAAARLQEARGELAEQSTAVEAAVERERGLATARTAATTAAELLQDEAERLAAAAAGITGDELERATWVVERLVPVAQRLPQLASAATVAHTRLRAAEAVLAEALVAAGMVAVDDALPAVLDERDEAALAEQVAEWRAALATTTQRLQTFESMSVPATRPDVADVADRAATAAAAANEAARRFTTADNAQRASRHELARAAQVAAESGDLRQARDTARIVFRTCNGEAGMRVKLERWVLAGELDRVTAAANAHLARMTNHRYRLARDGSSKGGLTLEVFDAHTGRSRPTSSLSGGEQFQASLSLALGLADVVSHGGTASGKVFEALFVDEGFGALDADALDVAIDALVQLQAAGRMVGAITHVEAMKQRLHVGVEVQPLPDGRGSTLKVHP